MTTCTNCRGEGLVGSGDQPWLKQGDIHTCKECHGIGEIHEPASLNTAQSDVPAEPVNETASETVDNSDKPNFSDGSSDGQADQVNGNEVAPAEQTA